MCVRSSIAFYGNFNLDMGRSPGFGSAPTDYIRPIQTWFPFGSGPSVLNLASQRNSPDRSTKSTRLSIESSSTACKHMVSGSLSLPSRGPFTFPSQYYARSVTKEYLALRGGPRSFPQGFSCLVVLWILLCFLPFRLRGSHPLWPVFPEPFRYSQKS